MVGVAPLSRCVDWVLIPSCLVLRFTGSASIAHHLPQPQLKRHNPPQDFGVYSPPINPRLETPEELDGAAVIHIVNGIPTLLVEHR